MTRGLSAINSASPMHIIWEVSHSIFDFGHNFILSVRIFEKLDCGFLESIERDEDGMARLDLISDRSSGQ
jgi:hypothetical protein